MRKKALLLFLVLSSLFSFGQTVPDTTQKIIPGRTNSPEQQQKPYVILISIDGFRYDYAEKYGAENILKFGNGGVRAESMIPSYPSLTFPNHYTLVTGLYPSHHGLVNNYFYDRNRKQFYSMRNPKTVKDGTWYGGTPLWVLAEQQKMLTAIFYWVGSEADIKGVLPTYYYTYNEAIPIDRRIQVVKEWLQLPPERRPHLITFYFPEVDHNGHSFGPDAPQTVQSVRWVDSAIKKLVDEVSSTGLPVNFILVSDHGMTKIDTEHPLPKPAGIDSTKFIVPQGSELVELYAKNDDGIGETFLKLFTEAKDYKVYLRENMPEELHYGIDDDVMNRIGNILLIPDWPKVFSFTSRKLNPGAHGFNPYLVKDMQATFMAWGPAFKNELKIPPFQNVNVFPIITSILGLKYTDKIDGTPAIAKEVLK
ncbi:MAG: alkaline phosphatase family protein [Bacteroidetes bacterium]|nr:alkaline phosphatase family protein [Bacteroidota bacterium]MBS1633418.1 alkaline phosphatase family protein [Bacteroidota bacterium]